MHVWIGGEIVRITVSHHDLGKNYTLYLQQKHDGTVILPNPLLNQLIVQLCTRHIYNNKHIHNHDFSLKSIKYTFGQG
jgi:hypothetical protein